jgi:AcrR family transcriptional regulator
VAQADRRRNLVELDILDRSAALFAARGYAATSMQDIAEALGLSRPSLYHYFGSKEEILANLIEGLAGSAEAALAEASRSTSPPHQKLHELVVALTVPIAEAPGRFRLLQTTDKAVIKSAESRLRRLESAVVRTVGEVVRDGMAAGLFRRMDLHVATFGVLGIVNWVAWWYTPGRGADVGEMCTLLADMAVASLRAPGAAQPLDSPRGVIAAIRRDLEHLEGLLGGE